MAREERDRGKRVKMGYRKLQINGEWFTWDERNGRNILRRRIEEEMTHQREKVKREGE
jgi:hypothetical protein